MIRFWAVFSKEAILILRDRRTLFMTVFFPVFMLLLYSFGVTSDINMVPSAALDFSGGPSARELIQKMNATGYINIKYAAGSYDELSRLLVEGDIVLGFVFPADFERKVKSGQPTTIQVLVNGSDANTASVAMAYQSAILTTYNTELIYEKAYRAGQANLSSPGVVAQTRIWYNPELKSIYYMAPGVIAMVMMVLGSLLTATSIVREKESGTIEMFIATPIRRMELVLGKIIPYVIVSLVGVVILLLVSYFGLRVPIKGNLGLLFLGILLYLTCALGYGLFASAVSNTVSSANFIAVFSSLLPSILLSGFIFPIESMPPAIQLFTYTVPARYFIVILRGIFLKDVGMSALWPQYLFLLIFGSGLLILSASLFKKRID
jgi:ABC-2 type transport system permease protein